MQSFKITLDHNQVRFKGALQIIQRMLSFKSATNLVLNLNDNQISEEQKALLQNEVKQNKHFTLGLSVW